MWFVLAIATAEEPPSLDGVQLGASLNRVGWTCEVPEVCWRNSTVVGYRGQTVAKLHGEIVDAVWFQADFSSTTSAVAAFYNLVEKMKGLGWACFDFSRGGVNANGASCSMGSRRRTILRTMENRILLQELPAEAGDGTKGL
jgi:hypothetical protein